ncbi:MAG: hypothetical protein Ct9H300mP14_03420 [Gammaproteobacteria bacterium]|nr:MAG: hypothetical protein Ct9H300mP14_03420 [Gammaproteobacteria bacterium]
MAGVSDRPYRRLARIHGAALAVSEMISANPALRHSSESFDELITAVKQAPSVFSCSVRTRYRWLKLRSSMRSWRQYHRYQYGCPSKKVCNRRVGSALLRHEILVGQIFGRCGF